MSIQQPLVSVVTPSFNSARFIRETINSVRSQNYPSIEHIVIDGGSTDGTLQILHEYPHLTWVSEPDRGQSDALNKGFQRVKGEIVGWLNSDDTYQPDAISTAVNFLLEHDNVDLVYSDARVIDEAGWLIGITKAQPFDQNLLLHKNYINQPTVFMRRHVIDSLGGVNTELEFVMDWELWLRIGLVFKMYYLHDQVLANFRLIPGTKSFDQPLVFQAEVLQVLENAFQTTPLSNLPEKTKQKVLLENQAKYHVAKMVDAIQRQDRKMMFQEMCLAITQNKRLILNRGIWYYCGKGLMGQKIDRLRKYKK